MNWTASVPALFGTVVGGSITIVGQALTDRRREREAQLAHKLALKAEWAIGQRLVTYELLDRVTADIATFREVVGPAVADLVNIELVEVLHKASGQISAAEDRCRSLVSKVADSTVRESAREVYRAWGTYCASYADELMNNGHDVTHLAQAAIESPDTFHVAVEGYFRELDEGGR